MKIFYFGSLLETTAKNEKVSCCGCCTHREGHSTVSSNHMGNKFSREKSYAESSRRSGKEAEKEISFLESQCHLSQGSSLP